MMSEKEINKFKVNFETSVEDLALYFPKAVSFLTAKGIRCIRCGEPLWCSLGELFEQDEVENQPQLLHDLNKFIEENYT